MSLQKRAIASASSEADLCVFCNKTLLRGRLLSCLHNICVSCVREKLGGSNDIFCPRCGTVTKPPTSGVPLYLALPNSYNLELKATESSQERSASASKALCDECMDEKAAEKICIDCGLRYCGVHATGHKMSRATHSHTLHGIAKWLSEKDGQVVQSSACPLHGSNQLELFCEKCGELFCDRCKQYGAHQSHEDSIVPAGEAAKKLRVQLHTLRNLEHGMAADNAAQPASQSGNRSKPLPDERNQIQASLEAVKASITFLNQRTEAVSGEVNSAFDRAIDAAKQRQQSLIDSLDSNRWTNQTLLQDQQRRLERVLDVSEQIDLLMERCQNDLDFLRMAPWLQKLHEHIAACMEKDGEPAELVHMVFEPRNLAEAVDLLSSAGETPNIAVDVAKSVISCTRRIVPGQDLNVTITAKDSSGSPIALDIAKQLQFSVSLKPEEGDAVPCELTSGSSSSVINAFLKSPAAGTHQLVATFTGNKHFNVSPLTIQVTDVVQEFNPSQKGSNLSLSNNKTATLTAVERHTHYNYACQTFTTTYGSVCSASSATSGLLQFDVRIDHVCGSHNAVHLMVSGTYPQSFDHVHKSNAYGWSVHSSGSGLGGGVSPAVQQGDVIAVTLDCDRSTVTFTLQRTGESQTIRNLPVAEYFLCVSMSCSHTSSPAQVTLL